MPKPHNPTEHRMTRRSMRNDYSLPGMYHVTVRVPDDTGHPFGRVVGNASLPDGTEGAPHVELSAIGRMVEQELLNSITAHYSMVQVQDHVVMPEHLHFIIEVHAPLISTQGRKAHLGQVIAGFKKGCNRRFWAMTGQGTGNDSPASGSNGDSTRRGKPAGTNGTVPCPAVSPQGQKMPPQEENTPRKVPSRGSSGRPALFAPGYVDVMPLRSGQLQTQRLYIRNNPRNRLLRSIHRDVLHTQRGGIDTALTVKALMGYLQRECPAKLLTPEITAKITAQLLTQPQPLSVTTPPAQTAPQATVDAPPTPRTIIGCDTYGNRQLLTRRLLPVVCHHRDTALFAQQKAQCLKAAREGAVLVSARIAKGEQEIIDAALAEDLPVVIMTDNGMPDLYHPTENRLAQCLAGKLLMVTPWHYHYRIAEEGISVAMCKTMNCVVQALCRKKDDWWKELRVVG